MSRLAPLFALALVVLAAPPAFAQPAKPVAKPGDQAADHRHEPASKPATQDGDQGAQEAAQERARRAVPHQPPRRRCRCGCATGRGARSKGCSGASTASCAATTRTSARDEPAPHAPPLPDREALAGQAPGGGLGLSPPDGGEEPAQPAHAGAGLRFPRRRGEGGRASRLPAARLREGRGRLLPELVLRSPATSARTGRRSGSTIRVRGERAVYSENPERRSRSGRADKYHPTKIDASWANEGESGSRPRRLPRLATRAGSSTAALGAAQAPSAAAPQTDDP